MKGFKFKFKKVLRVREIEEDKALNLFHKIQEKVKEIEIELEKKRNKQRNIYNYIREQDRLSSDFMTVVRRYLKINREKIKKLDVELTEMKKKVAERRKEYIECRKKRRVMERLKEKELKKEQKKVLSKEQKELDEVGQQIREA